MKTLLIVLLFATTVLTACIVPGRNGEPTVLVPALPSVVVMDQEEQDSPKVQEEEQEAPEHHQEAQEQHQVAQADVLPDEGHEEANEELEDVSLL